MDGYQAIIDSYKKMVEQKKISEEDAISEIRIYDFLAKCDKNDIYRIVDSSAMNDILKAYTKQACATAGLTDIQQDEVMNSLKWLLDTKTAKEIVEKM